MRSRHLLAAPLLAAGILAGCGANNADTAHIVPPPQQSQTLTYTATSTSSTATAPTIVTPKTGPLSTEPKVTVPTTPAPTTLVKKDLIAGTGAVAQSGDTITVNYVGALFKNGTVFDASWKRSQTFPVVLGAGQVIKGWDQGLVGMRVGGRRELIIPPSLAYGATPQTGIPANSTLIFIIDLLGLTPAAGATGVTGATAATGATG
jgi:peptidylprolyl isomerase